MLSHFGRCRLADYASDAVLHPGYSYSMPPHTRIEGPAAIRAHFAALFRAFPERRFVRSQLSVRAYHGDLVILNYSATLSYTDPQSRGSKFEVRNSMTWTKLDGRWPIVDHHVSRPEP